MQQRYSKQISDPDHQFVHDGYKWLFHVQTDPGNRWQAGDKIRFTHLAAERICSQYPRSKMEPVCNSQ